MPSKVSTEETAWLAGLFDGEGSIGIQKHGRSGLRPSVQMSMTCATTIARVIELLGRMEIRVCGYTYQEREARHKDAHYIRINRLVEVNRLARVMVKYAVIKLRHWQLIMRFTDFRLAEVSFDEEGRVSRGSKAWTRPFSRQEHAVQQEIHALNVKGRPTRRPVEAARIKRAVAASRRVAGQRLQSKSRRSDGVRAAHH